MARSQTKPGGRVVRDVTRFRRHEIYCRPVVVQDPAENPPCLGDLIEHFRNSGLGKQADSWVSTGQNEPVDETQMGQALGPDLLDTLAQQTGLSRDELLKRLSAVLPQAVDHLTPGGNLPPRSREGAA